MKTIYKISKEYYGNLLIKNLEIVKETEKTYIVGNKYPERILKSGLNIVKSSYDYEVYTFDISKGIEVIKKYVEREIKQNVLQNIRLRKFVEILEKEVTE